MLFVNTATASGAAITLIDQWNPWLTAWVGLQFVVTCVRILLWLQFYRLNRPDGLIAQPRLWYGIYTFGLWTSGLLWAVLAVSLTLTGDLLNNAYAEYTVFIIISALAGGASGVTATLLLPGATYISILLAPLAFSLLLGAGGHRIIGVLALVFWAVMSIGIRTNHRILRRSLALEERNVDLIDALSHLNRDLESRIHERTQRLRALASTDSLTGLLNRHGLTEWWDRQVAQAPEIAAVVFFLDLDRFKHVNDALGHDVGDRVLTATAHRILGAVPAGAALARWGGDEFVLACPGQVATAEFVDGVAARIAEALNMPLSLDGETVRLGVSIGWSSYPDDDRSFSDVVHAADLAVTEIKRTRRGAVLAYSETFAETLRRRFDLSRALGEAIGTDQISLVYQPIVDVDTGEIVCREALARWNHPVLGPIRPDEFIRLAEDSDRIVALGNWVLKRACQDAVAWRAAGHAIRVAVNCSMKQLVSDTFRLKLLQILEQTGLPAQALDLEVTESVFDDEHIDVIAGLLVDLKTLGVRVQIDDFGTGYSSLSRLKRLTVDAIKIDRAFVADMDGQGRVIIESAVMIAKSFGLKVIAEGVETEAQAVALRRIGVDMLQGYLTGRPEAAVVTRRVTPSWLKVA